MTQLELSGEQSCGIEGEDWTRIMKALVDAFPPEGTVERRRDSRYPFPFPVYLTPITEDGVELTDESIVGAGRDLSEGGLAFYHAAPLCCRRLVVSVEKNDGEWLAFSLELKRSRCIRHGWYESSGQFRESVLPPIEPIRERS